MLCWADALSVLNYTDIDFSFVYRSRSTRFLLLSQKEIHLDLAKKFKINANENLDGLKIHN